MTEALVKLQYTLQHKIQDSFQNEKGATAVEYGLFVALIAAVIVAIVVILGGQINNAFKKVSDALGAAVAN